LALAANVALAAPAQAAPLQDLTRAEATSPTDTLDKEVTAYCPAGTKAYSTGASVSKPTVGRVVIDKILPLRDRSGVQVGAKSLGAVSPWRVTAYAVCARPGTSLTSADSGAPIDSSDTAACSRGTRLTGAGGIIANSTGDQALVTLEPDVTLTRATAGASGGAGTWTVSARAICDDVAGLKLVQTMGLPAVATTTVSCGAGYNVLGSGGKVVSAPGAIKTLIAIEPDQTLTSVTVSGSATDSASTAVAADGAGRWSVAAYAVCVPAD
jgi:hypothetical protein